MTQRQAVTTKKALVYQSGSRAAKSRILDELVDLTGWHRDYARAALRQTLAVAPVTAVVPRHGRILTYRPELMPAFVRCWAVLTVRASRTAWVARRL